MRMIRSERDLGLAEIQTLKESTLTDVEASLLRLMNREVPARHLARKVIGFRKLTQKSAESHDNVSGQSHFAL